MATNEAQIVFQSSFLFDSNRIRAAAVYCSDGRFGDQFDDLLHNALQLPRYDRLRCPGAPPALPVILQRTMRKRRQLSNCVSWSRCMVSNASS